MIFPKCPIACLYNNDFLLSDTAGISRMQPNYTQTLVFPLKVSTDSIPNIAQILTIFYKPVTVGLSREISSVDTRLSY